MASKAQMKRQNAWITSNLRCIKVLIHKDSEQENMLIARLETYCDKTGKSRNACILNAIREYLEKRGE